MTSTRALILATILMNIVLQPNLCFSSPLSKWLDDNLKQVGQYEQDCLSNAARGQTPDAIGLWSACMRIYKRLPAESAEAALIMAYYKMKVGLCEEALPYVSKAVLRAQDDIAPLILRAGYFEKKGIINGLVVTLERCVRLEPLNEKMRLRLIMAYARRKKPGDRDKAFANAKVLTEANTEYALKFVKIFRQGKQNQYMQDKVAEHRVNQSIIELRTQRPTMSPRHFKKSVGKTPAASPSPSSEPAKSPVPISSQSEAPSSAQPANSAIATK